MAKSEGLVAHLIAALEGEQDRIESSPLPFRTVRGVLYRATIDYFMHRADGNKTEASRLMGLNRTTIRTYEGRSRADWLKETRGRPCNNNKKDHTGT